jgi:predicted nucleic acid-binding protein
MIVVADTSPLRYLVWIDKVELIPALYGSAWIPPAVVGELHHFRTTLKVKRWISAPPLWLQIRTPSEAQRELPLTLGAGERDAIALAEEIYADLLLIDDWAGRREAERRNLTVQGTLGFLSLPAQTGLTDLPNALARLRETSFRASDELLQSLIDEDARRKKH